MSAPAADAVGGGVDVESACLAAVQHLGVGVESWQHGVGLDGCAHFYDSAR